MRRTYRKDKTVGLGDWGRVITLLLLPLLLSIYAFSGAVAQEAAADDSATLKVQEANGKLPSDKIRGVRSGYEQSELAGFKLHSDQKLDLLPLLIGAGIPKSKIILAGSDSGSISGRVTDSTGAGIQNVWVEVFDTDRWFISGASTDANGNYTAIGIPTGAYNVVFYGRHLGYLYEWYNNKHDLCNANPVAVTAPNVTSGIDAVLEVGGSISGRVTDSNGTGIQNVGIDLFNTNDEWISYASTDANGNYTVIGIPTGGYKVSFYGSGLGYVHEWYNNTPDVGNADILSVTAPDAITGIDAVLKVGGSISGRVTDSTGTSIKDVHVDIFNSNGNWISWALTDADGIYTAGGVPSGANKVRFIGSHINEWYNDKPDFGIADTVSVTAPGTTTGVDAVLEFGSTGEISGRVTDSTGAGIQDVWVKVYDLNLGYWVLWVQTNAYGNYTADGLSTGQYKVQFFYNGCSGYMSEWYNNKPDSGSADTVAVTAPNATVGIDAVLSVKTWFEENDPAITYTGTWKNYTCAACNGGTMKYSGQTGAKADFSFNGTGIKWIVTKANLLGKARVYLDGVNMGLVDLYNPTAKYQVVLQKTGLAPGNHTITIEVSGQKNPASTGYFIDIDAFEVVP